MSTVKPGKIAFRRIAAELKNQRIVDLRPATISVIGLRQAALDFAETDKEAAPRAYRVYTTQKQRSAVLRFAEFESARAKWFDERSFAGFEQFFFVELP
jgi:hypothetical protein